ncbi:MAG: tandem-95 repeat protein [Pirellulaceae bacterium]|nr:tandem-95 repeat protein [Pirellulaceae bacterium]
MRFHSAKKHSDTQPSQKQTLRRVLSRLITSDQGDGPRGTNRGRLLLESLERRQLLAGDVDLFATDPGVDNTAGDTAAVSTSSDLFGVAQGEQVNDLVQFAQELADAGVIFYGAAWCPVCTQQKEIFEDGGNELLFEEVTLPNRQRNPDFSFVNAYPTWDFGGPDLVEGFLTLQEISDLSGIPIPQSEDPIFETIPTQVVRTGSPLHVPVDVYDPDGGIQNVTVSVDNPALVEAVVLTGNRSIVIDMETYGDMVFELFEQRAPEATARVIALADNDFDDNGNIDDTTGRDFYDGIIFHRVIDNFVIQGGDPTGTGTGGSPLDDFDDDFHPDLQHNRSGVLSFAKTSDDTNNSQFFITEGPTRHLDFNHSIIGQLVEGSDVREAISEHEVDGSSKPTTDIAIESINVFDDFENSVIMLRAVGNATGSTNMTVRVTDPDGNTFSQIVPITVAADTANSQPFLNDVNVAATYDSNAAAQLQLSSVDIENDPVRYFAVNRSTSTGASVSVNETTGLVTVTPTNNFVGAVNVLVGVEPGPTVTGNGADDFDSQLVTFNFELDQLNAPTSLDLLSGSDSGISNSDNITATGTLTFDVEGVVDGAQVEIVNVNGGSNIGLAIASGGRATISTNNLAALGDGTYSLAARQTLSGVTSDLSPSITVVYDSTGPDTVSHSAITTGNATRLYQSDLISSEEGSGLRYALTTAPSNATIDSITGQISWTPTTDQVGTNAFELTLTDAAGNVTTDSFSVVISGEPLVDIEALLLDSSGNEVTSIQIGDRFTLRLNAIDSRPSNQRGGVFAAYVDVLFDNTVIRPVPGAAITFGTDLSSFTTGNIATGLIDEVGGTSSSQTATGRQTNLIATLDFEAIDTGTVNFLTEPGEATISEILLYGVNNEIPAESIAFGSATLAVGQSFTVANDNLTVAEDSGATSVNVLGNDVVVSGNTTLSVVAVTQPTTGGSVTLTDGVVAFTPSLNFNGTTEFIYRVSDTNGIQDNATVTVTVTPVNDAPTGGADNLSVNQNSTDNTLNVLANDSSSPDAAGSETLTIVDFTPSTANATIAIAADGRSILYTPATNFSGTDTFSYTLSDGSLVSEVAVSVVVAPADPPPTAVADAFTIAEDTDEAVYAVTANDTRDTDNQSFVIDSVGVPSQGGTARVSADGSQFFYEPADNFVGTETVTYTLRDTGGGLAVGTVTFNVTAVNDNPPVLNKTAHVTRGSTETTVMSLPELPTNVDGVAEVLGFTNLGTTSAGGTVRIDVSDDLILYTPPTDTFVGTDTFTYSVQDATGATSNGTITVEVNDFTRRNIVLNQLLPGVTGVRLTGTNLVGETVDLTLTNPAQSATFENLLPGSYVVQIPSIPFLVNGEEVKEISVTSAPEDGDMTIETGLGRLRPEFISIRDWLGSTSRETVLFAVAPGSSSVLSIPTPSTSTVTNPMATLDSTGSTVTLTGTGTTGEDVQAVVSAADNGHVQVRGRSGELLLYKINVQSDVVAFEPTNGASAAQAEQIIAAEDGANSQPIGVDAVDSQLAVADQSPQGEWIASQASSQIDLFVPATSDFLGRSDATVLQTQEGDLWVGESTLSDQMAPVVADPIGQNQQSVDQAMQAVSPRLSLLASSADVVAETTSGSNQLEKTAIDSVLADEI